MPVLNKKLSGECLSGVAIFPNRNHERNIMDFKHLKTIAIASALISALTVSAYATSIGGATVTADSLELRTEPSAESSALLFSPQGSVVVVEAKINDNWFKVICRGATGFMSSDSISFNENLEGSFGTGTIFGTGVRMRDAASLNSGVINVFDTGTKMDVLGVCGVWYKVRYNGQTGFVFSDYLALSGAVSEQDSSESEGQKIVDTAMKYLGVPYVYGGTTVNGFDCSGFVQYVYKECGYTVDRTAAQIYENGTYVEKVNLEIGDAICFSSHTESIGHVGIYIGNGQFIHASSGSGCVIISDLSENYYDTRYVGARRII